MSSLYILDINPLSVALFANIFCCSIGCLFILLTVSFAVRSFQVLLGPICLFLLLFLLPWETDLRILLQFMSENVLPIFSSFMVSCLIFRSLNYFEIIFCVRCEGVF